MAGALYTAVINKQEPSLLPLAESGLREEELGLGQGCDMNSKPALHRGNGSAC